MDYEVVRPMRSEALSCGYIHEGGFCLHYSDNPEKYLPKKAVYMVS